MNDDSLKRCCKCKEPKARTEFGKCVTTKDGLNHACRVCHNAYRRKWGKDHPDVGRKACYKYLEENPSFKLWIGAKARAKKSGKPFSITRQDIVIPEFCPILGIKLECGKGNCCDSSPSLDAIIPENGYELGNIAVISHKANTIKNNATLDELKQVTEWLERVLQSETPALT